MSELIMGSVGLNLGFPYFPRMRSYLPIGTPVQASDARSCSFRSVEFVAFSTSPGLVAMNLKSGVRSTYKVRLPSHSN